MKLVYSFVSIENEGSCIHIDNFISSFKKNGNKICENRYTMKPFVGGKEKWSIYKKINAKLIFVRQNLFLLFKTLFLIVKFKPDVLLFRFSHNHVYFLTVLLCSKFKPVVLEINAVKKIESVGSSGRLGVVLDKILINSVKRCFVVSSELKDYIVSNYRINKDKVDVVINGVDIDKFNHKLTTNLKVELKLRNNFVVGFVGSFLPWTGLDNLLVIAKEFKLYNPQVMFLVVGDGKDRSKYEKYIAENGLNENVILTGYVPHDRVIEYISIMDVTIAPYSYDYYKGKGLFYGSPLKIFEYMAMAKPVIAPPMGQINDLVNDGVTGKLIYAENVEEIKNEISRMFVDREYCNNLGRNARKLVSDKYTWDINAKKVENICSAVLAKQ